jgi:hypothetical protein
VVKTSERFTKGIPDIYIAVPHTWLEIKLLKPGDSLAECSDPMQRFTMLDFFEATHGRAWYVVYDARTRKKRVVVYLPATVDAAARGEEVADSDAVLTAEGFNHKAVADFVMRLTAADASAADRP